jgi:hypothetical protein
MLDDLADHFNIVHVSNCIVAQTLRKNGLSDVVDRILLLEEFLTDTNPAELLDGLELLPTLDGEASSYTHMSRESVHC